MPQLIVVRLHPAEPVDADVFRTSLNDLKITAHDIRVQPPAPAPPALGSASILNIKTNYYLDPAGAVDPANARIFQHFVNAPHPIFPLFIIRTWESVATAIIEVTTPPPVEYPAPEFLDVRLEIERAGKTILHKTIHYNVSADTLAVPVFQPQAFGMEADVYVEIPSAGVGSGPGAHIDLPEDGTPPSFDQLTAGINAVLALDPGGGATLQNLPQPLTIQMSRVIAAELTWDRSLFPRPIPDEEVGFGQMYTKPPFLLGDDEEDKEKAERARMAFEAKLKGYQATHEAEAIRLIGFVYAASAAVFCEKQSYAATEAGLTFPLITPASSATTLPTASVLLTSPTPPTPPLPLNPAFGVPAAYYYALGAMLPPQVGADQRYKMAVLLREEQLIDELESAIDSGAIAVDATNKIPPFASAGTSINKEQAARRFNALGTARGSLSLVPLDAAIRPLLTAWLAYEGTSKAIDAAFWDAEVGPGDPNESEYLQLLLVAITANHQPLIAAIRAAPFNVITVQNLVDKTDKAWRELFLGSGSPLPDPPPGLALLPPFTEPGTPAERTAAFIRHLHNFFKILPSTSTAAAPPPGAPPTLERSITDVLQAFIDAYNALGSPFEFGQAWDLPRVQAAITSVLPGDPDGQAWLRETLDIIEALFLVTDIGQPERRFSLIEALYSRGFTSKQSIAELSAADFQKALTGTIAYPYAGLIYGKAGGIDVSVTPPSEGGFVPVNPGDLIDCIPPPHLSPFGPVKYLQELLQVSPGSTCDEPLQDDSATRLDTLLGSRRGDLGSLLASRANLETPLPVIDMVNESLEKLAADQPAITGGAVYDTSADKLFDHDLRKPGLDQAETDDHDPQTLFGALPEHSSPATPVKEPGAYSRLKETFTAPDLPYHQVLDVNRSYLRQLGSSRFSAMRHFRRDITEFVLDPSSEPADFQRHLWRFPVRLETALEYLGISPEEYDLLYAHNIETGAPVAGRLFLRDVYGFPSDTYNGVTWSDAVLEVSEFIARTGLTYCEFLELKEAKFVEFKRAGQEENFPDCQPCCPDDLRMEFGADTLVALRSLAVFIRLWRRLRELRGVKISFVQLRDICDELELFTAGSINPEFIRQLVALIMLCDFLRLSLQDEDDPSPAASGALRTHLLALWVDPAGPSAAKRPWAIGELLDKIEDYAEARHHGKRRPPEFLKLLADNLNALSRLAGFDPGEPRDTWHAHPTHTLRFVEVLAKIYASDFSVGEVLLLFTEDDHLHGDDPFPLTEDNEALDTPLELPHDGGEHSLLTLRRKLLAVAVEDAEKERWTWARIQNTLRSEFGFVGVGSPDALETLGEHFFPSILLAEGGSSDPQRRQFRVSLAPPPPPQLPALWNRPPGGPFHYDTTTQELWAQLPLTDEAVSAELSDIRQLNAVEQDAVRDVYFAPRAMLAPFALIFQNFDAAASRLIQEPSEQERWSSFQSEFARFYKRCQLIAEHLATHVAAATDGEEVEGDTVAWLLLRSLFGDENLSIGNWENDPGTPPGMTWSPPPNGGAFAALLGLVGTGIVGEFSVGSGPIWREVRGPLDAFGQTPNRWNSPVPTVIPSMSLTLSAAQQQLAFVRNGYAGRNSDGEVLGGAQAFRASWQGALLIEREGHYTFEATVPSDANGDTYERDGVRWRVILNRGQRRWILANHRWPGEDAPQGPPATLPLRRGSYEIIAEFEETEPNFDREEDICARQTGFRVMYSGPDSHDELVPIPFENLFLPKKEATLADGLAVGSAATSFLSGRYMSSLRDIRRTYQRAFKALLFAHRFRLSTRPAPGETQSELSYMLEHESDFAGSSYLRAGAVFPSHKANFNFNFLPVADSFFSPSPVPLPMQDQRAHPSAKRKTALFDWWERIFDYTQMRRETGAAIERPAWLLFNEASQRQPDDSAQLLRHLSIDMTHAPLVLTYYEAPPAPPYEIVIPDLEDERWAIRAWQAEKWLRNLEQQFYPLWIGDAIPYLWASDDPATPLGGLQSGNENLTAFVRDGYIENGEPRRYEDLRQLNDALRERARGALLDYLCGMNRIGLPWSPGEFAAVPRDLSDLLLMDVEAGICDRASRVEQAISSIQTFVQRARLGLEPGFPVVPAFVLVWDRRFTTYRTWEVCARHEMYSENMIDWREIERARHTEAYQLLESELRSADLTVPVPGGLEWWPDRSPPIFPSLMTLQAGEPSRIRLFETDPAVQNGPYPEGLGLMGTPERDARPSWLSPIQREGFGQPVDDTPGVRADVEGGEDDTGTVLLVDGSTGNEPTDGDGSGSPDGSPPSGAAASTEPNSPIARTVVPLPLPDDDLPLWIRAAVRLGVRFVRVAAAAVPQASARFAPRHTENEDPCCTECGRVHAPLVDEYYFWLQKAHYYDDDPKTWVDTDLHTPITDPDIGKDPSQLIDGGITFDNPTSDWQRPDKLPSLLYWQTHPAVILHWSRFHNGEFMQPRRSEEGVAYDPVGLGDPPQLDFMGRTADSLRFEVFAGVRPVGYDATTPPGFRYDIATDSAVVLPLIDAVPSGTAIYPEPLIAYPFFAYHQPGAPLMPSVYSVALTVAAALRAHCQYEAALKWYELAYKPLSFDNSWPLCREDSDVPIEGPQPDEDETETIHAARLRSSGVADRRCCPSAPVDDATARDRAVLLKYLETLLEWGDALVCRNSPEAFHQAWVNFSIIEKILGPFPEVIEVHDEDRPQKIKVFVPSAAPLNPRLIALYERAADRRALLRSCVGARRLPSGRPNLDMPYFANTSIRNGWETAGDVCLEELEWCLACCDPYRFVYRVQQAKQLAGFVRGLSAQLLAAFEKGDAEYLAHIRAAQERQLLQLGLQVRENQWRDADWQVQALQKTKEGAQARRRYYRTLLVSGLNGGEIAYEALLGVSMASHAASQVTEAVGQGVGLMPDFFLGVAGWAGSPLQFSHITGGTKISGGISIAARILNLVADVASTSAGLSLTRAGWDRREAEWRHQVEVIGIETEQIERQILGAERRRDAALRELNNHQRTLEHSIEVQNIRRDMFANHQLYVFLQQETSALAYQAFELARSAAMRALGALNYELGYTTLKLLPETGWDNLHEGLLAGERLELSLHQMEKAYQDANCREYELTKNISLRLAFPQAFLQLQATGRCEIELPEWMFDLDYPGHYMRRIKSVRLTIPAVVGPYTGVHCRLTLLSSLTRIDPRPTLPPEACCPGDPSDVYQARPDDPRIVRSYAATEAIATSTGQNDAGLFELNFRDERYLPFEFAGAVSRWRIELPHENNHFDFDSLSDVVLHLGFTAREGGEPLRGVANESAQKQLPGAGLRLFDLRHDFPDAWHRMQAGTRQGLLPLVLGREHFPFLPSNRRVRVNRMEIFFEVAQFEGDGSQLVHFVREHERAHGSDDECDCGGYNIECVASADWPGLYHGVLNIDFGTLDSQDATTLGVLRFPGGADRPVRGYLICGYESDVLPSYESPAERLVAIAKSGDPWPTLPPHFKEQPPSVDPGEEA
ncbi:MAG: neuraminidase-like domain-containing protein [Gemmatimonadota bacterium]